MYATFYELFQKLFGIDIPALSLIKVFGFFFALAFLVAAYFLASEFKRLEKAGFIPSWTEKTIIGGGVKWSEVLINAFVGFVLGYKILFALLNWSDFIRNSEAYIANTNGNMLGGLLGALLYGAYVYYNQKKAALPQPKVIEAQVYPHTRVFDLVILAAVFGILGAKFFSFFEYWDVFLQDPIGHLLSFSGLNFYGGLIVAAIALAVYAKRKNIPLLRFMDSTAPALIIAYGVGRLGCHFSGDGDWGIVNSAPKPSFLPNWLWALHYPNNVAREGVPIPGCEGPYCFVLDPPVYPTSVYEFFMALAIFGILWSLRKKLTPIPGILFAIYMVLNGIERFCIETIRVNDRYDVLGFQLSQAQSIAILLVTLGIILGIFVYQRSKKNPLGTV